jgi:hypothetical protein
MKSMKILYYGLLTGFLLGFSVSVLNSAIEHDSQIIAWPLLNVFILFLLFLPFLSKAMNANSEWVLMALNIIIVAFAFVGFLLPFSDFWLAKSTGPASIALGLPCLLAIIYWNKVRVSI